jgi:leucyl aminopeptidase
MWIQREHFVMIIYRILICDTSLTEFNKGLITEYLDIPFVETKCGYACSDQ